MGGEMLEVVIALVIAIVVMLAAGYGLYWLGRRDEARDILRDSQRHRQ